MLILLRCLLLNELIVAVSAISSSLVLPRILRVLVVRVRSVRAFVVILRVINVICLLVRLLLHDGLVVLARFI